MIAEEDVIKPMLSSRFLSSRMLLFKCDRTWSSIDKADKNAAAPVVREGQGHRTSASLFSPAAAPVPLPGDPCTLQSGI